MTFQIKPGKDRKPGVYNSIQNFFPDLYGINANGLPEGADEAQKVMALQLKGYLLFFEQLLANFHGQTVQINQLLSFDHNPLGSYAFEPLAGITDLEKVLQDPWLYRFVMHLLTENPTGGKHYQATLMRVLEHHRGYPKEVLE